MNHRKCRFLACKKKKSLIFKEKKKLTSSYATFYLVRTLQFFFFIIDNWPQIQPKYQYLFHKNFPVRDFSIMTLISFIASIFQLFFKFFRQAETWNSAHRSSQLDLILPFLKFTSGNNNSRFAGGAMSLDSSHFLSNSWSLNSDNGLSMHQRVGRIIYWGSARKKKWNLAQVPIMNNLACLITISF